MSKLTLIPGQKVRHIRTGNLYVIKDLNHLHKEGNDWISSVIYAPAAQKEYNTFSRSTHQFNAEFVNA